MKNSYWIESTKEVPNYPKIEKDISTNIVIIGAGLTGLSTAYYLSKDYLVDDILILEADKVCYGASGRNTGKLSTQHGLIYHELIDKKDLETARLYYQANIEGLNNIQRIIKDNNINCNFEYCDSLLYTKDKGLINDIEKEYQAYQSLQIKSDYVNSSTFPISIEAGLVMYEQAKFNPYLYGIELAKIITKNKVQLYEYSPVKTMIKQNDETYTLLVGDYKINAKKVIFASQFPFIDHAHFYFAKMYCEIESIAYSIVENELPSEISINIDVPLHSYNAFSKHLLVAGNNYKSGQITEENNAMITHIKKTFAIDRIEYEWTSQDYMTFDKLPFIGKLENGNDNLFFASGFNKWGNTTSNIAGKILADYILNQPSQYKELFSCQRFTNLFSLKCAKENINVAYEFIKSKFKHKDDEYPLANEAKVLQIDHHTYGAYRNQENELFIVDITCPHAGCICNFNTIDKTWDCPCHGSRFTYRGEIIKGLSTKKLNAYGEGLNQIDPHIINE